MKSVKPELSMLEYQKVSAIKDFLLRISSDKYRKCILHTRDYCFSKDLSLEFGRIEKIYTRFGLFYMHCGFLYENLERDYRVRFDREIKRFNQHWGVFMFETSYDKKINKELNRVWLESKINLIENNWNASIYESESNPCPEGFTKYTETLRERVKTNRNIIDINWINIK